MIITYIIACFLLKIIVGSENSPTLYDPKIDDVEGLDKTTFMSLYNNERVAFVEFYSHWCGACKD
jgi:hypothetical protein